MSDEEAPKGAFSPVPLRRRLTPEDEAELSASMSRHPAGKKRVLPDPPVVEDDDHDRIMMWDKVHRRPADIYCPPEDMVTHRLSTRYRITTRVGSVTEQTLDEIEAEGGFPYLFTIARNLGLGELTIEAL